MAAADSKLRDAGAEAMPIAGPADDMQQRSASSDVVAAISDGDRIPFSRKMIFSAPTMATMPFLACWAIYGNRNYQAFGASLASIGLFTALARSLDVVSDPSMAYFTDTASFDFLPNWLRGRRKPFMFFGAFLYSGLLFCLLNPPYAGETSLSVWFGVFYTLYFLANTLTTIPYDAMAPELSEDSNERTGLFFIMNIFDGVGALIAVGLPIVMTQFAKIYLSRNDEICETETVMAQKCLSGRTCDTFLTVGWDGAFKANTAAMEALQNITSYMEMPKDVTRQCITWLRTHDTNDMLFAGSAAQNDIFCDCVGTCGDACDVANKRTGFTLVGFIFGAWMLCSMIFLVCRVPERIPSGPRPRSPPIVPSMRSALNNRLFWILLPAWLCDALVTAISQSLVPYFVEVVVSPAYQTLEEHGRDCVGEAGIPGGPNEDRLCDTDTIIAICGLLALCTAICVLPLWNFLVAKLGKVKTWYLWSLTMASSNVLFLFIFKGDIHLLFIVAAINGAPLGAKFLADSILADIIDYDEFITGTRSEAMYFMFKSFLPKIVQIPATAIPIALLGSFGYRDPVGGKPQDQPERVQKYIKVIVGLGFLCSVLAYFLKTKYPMRSEQIPLLAKALKERHECETEEHPIVNDPVFGGPFKLMTVSNENEQEAFWLFNHFDTHELRRGYIAIPEARCSVASDDPEELHRRRFKLGSDYLVRRTQKQFAGALCFLLAAIIGTCSTMSLLSNETWQFVPTLFVVCIGLGISSSAYTGLRHRAAKQLKCMALNPKKGYDDPFKGVEKLLEHHVQLSRLSAKHEAEVSMTVQNFAIDADNLKSEAALSMKEIPSVQQNLSKTKCCEDQISPIGLYQIVTEPCQVRQSHVLTSPPISRLKKGTLVEVLEVVTVENRVRGRIRVPAGWLSLCSTDGNSVWAVECVWAVKDKKERWAVQQPKPLSPQRLGTSQEGTPWAQQRPVPLSPEAKDLYAVMKESYRDYSNTELGTILPAPRELDVPAPREEVSSVRSLVRSLAEDQSGEEEEV